MAKSNSGNTSRNEAPMARRRINRWPLVYALPLDLFLASGCKKTEPAAPAPQPAAEPARTVPPVPAQPVPTFSAAQAIGMFLYPKANQTHDQQLIDESDCYNSVQQQTGINPQASGPQAPSAVDQNAAAQQGAAQAQQAQGGRLRGAARGAAGGAAIGAITGNAGRGAAIGAAVGTVRGGRRQRQANEEAKDSARKLLSPSSSKPTGRARRHTTK
jgi:hypothetical protein